MKFLLNCFNNVFKYILLFIDDNIQYYGLLSCLNELNDVVVQNKLINMYVIFYLRIFLN